MSYKITKSEIKKIGTIKLPKGIWLNHIDDIIGISINPDIAAYMNPDHIIHNLMVLLSKYKPSNIEQDICIKTNLKIDYDCTKSDCTNEWTFYEKVEDIVKVKPNTPEEIWTSIAYESSKK